MSSLTLVLILAGTMTSVTVIAVLAWFCYTAYLMWFERRLERRKGMYRSLVSELAWGERTLDPEVHRPETLRDLSALEAALEEQARRTTARPAWLLEAYDRLGLIDKYVERLRHARRWRARALAAELLGRVGNAKAVPALLATVQATRVEDADVRDIALRALARIADPRAVRPLTEVLDVAEPWLAPHIADILVRHGEAAVEPLLTVLERPAASPSRAWAANVLGELRATAALPALLRALDDPDDEVRAKSATALGRLGDRSAVHPLLDHLLADPAPFVRARIANALGRFGDADVTDRLVHALGDPAWWVRVRSVDALEQIGPAAELSLLAALDNTHHEIQGRAAITLERLGTATTLAAAVRNGDDAPAAANTLAKFSSAGARELMAGLLMAPMEHARQATLRALRRGARRDLAPEIAQMAMGDPDPGLRAEALEALARFRVKEAIDAALEAERGDPDPSVRAMAIETLSRFGGDEAVRRIVAGVADRAIVVRAASIEAGARLSLQAIHAPVLQILRDDSAAVVRERAALATGLLTIPGGETALLAACLRPEPTEVHAAALLAIGKFEQESMVARLQEIPEAEQAQEVLRDRLHTDPWYRLLRCHLPSSRRPELRAITTHTMEAAEAALARGIEEVLEPAGRIRLIGGLRALHGQESRDSLMDLVHSDPSPEARTAALAALGGMLDSDELSSVARAALDDPSLLVRRAGVSLFSKVAPEKGFPILLRALRPGDDATVFAAAADLAAPAFRVFADVALRIPDDGDEALVVLRIAQRLSHPDLPRLLPVLARSRSPEVREVIATIWRERPEVADAEALAALTLDPAAGVRRASAHAASAIRAWSLLDRLAGDPDPSVRREAAISIGAARQRDPETDAVLSTLGDDIAMPVRAAAFAARLVQGVPVSLPPGVELREVAAALRESTDLATLRDTARTATDENQRLAAALALALLQDEVAHEIARTDPFPSIRHRVGGALELAAARPEAL